MSRVVCWFSCGAASAVATKLALMLRPDAVVAYCASTLSTEHPDNGRFLSECEAWFGKPIQLLYSDKYTDIYDVYNKTRWLVGPAGARCTTELKKLVRRRFQQPDDLQVFGFSVEERDRADRFQRNNLGVNMVAPLIDHHMTKGDCLKTLRKVGIEVPAMYKLGYKNNNCIGCVKGGLGYWNKIRVDFPEVFARMAKVERDLGAAMLHTETRCRDTGKRIKHRVYLDELPPHLGRYSQEPDVQCGVLCDVS